MISNSCAKLLESIEHANIVRFFYNVLTSAREHEELPICFACVIDARRRNLPHQIEIKLNSC